MRSSSRSGKTSVWSAVFTTAIVTIALILLIWVFGGVSGEEFSAQKFRLRRFHYFQLPLVKVQVWPLSFQPVSGTDDTLAKHIRSQRWVGPMASLPPRWDIVSMSEVGREADRGDAAILANYLRQPGAKGTSSWLDWSKQFPEKASFLWPLVARLAHEQMYVLIPNLLEEARRAESAEALHAAVTATLPADLRLLAEAERQSDNLDRAKQLTALAGEMETQPLPVGQPADPTDATVAEADPEEA